MSRNLKIAAMILMAAVLIGLVSLRSLQRRVERLAQSQAIEQRARREVVSPKISTPTDVTVNAKIFWISASSPDQLEPVNVPLPLSADPVLRAKQLLRELIANPPTTQQRTLPPDLAVLDFYDLPDGTAIADFSDELTRETPSGILSEELALNSITDTLQANVPALTRLKILIKGQQVETLAGHVDLTGFFNLRSPSPAASASASAVPAADPTPANTSAAGLTGSDANGKLAH